MSRKLRTMLGVSAAVAAMGVGAGSAQATAVWTAPYCSAVQSDDGHRLYPAICGTNAPGNHWHMVVTACGTSSCGTVTSPTWLQGQIGSFTTGGYITGVRFYLTT